ncbi:hypothetical protein ACFQX4_28505, partial [Roseomonas sp. GCM10028921]
MSIEDYDGSGIFNPSFFHWGVAEFNVDGAGPGERTTALTDATLSFGIKSGSYGSLPLKVDVYVSGRGTLLEPGQPGHCRLRLPLRAPERRRSGR